MAMVDVKVPDIGDFKDVAVIEVMVKVGETITVEQSLLTVESDKASMEIPSSHAGVVKALRDQGRRQGERRLGRAGAGGCRRGAAAPAAGAAPAAAAASPAAAGPAAAAPAAASGSSGPVNVAVPDIGDFKDVAVIELLVKPGDTVKVEQSLLTVESDKASMEIPSSHAGVVKALKVGIGDKVSQGSIVAVIEAVGGAAAPPPAPAAGRTADASPSAPSSTAPPAAAAAVPAHDPTAAKGSLPHASPSIRRLARELGVPLDEVKGSGVKGRITQDDVHDFVKARDERRLADQGAGGEGACRRGGRRLGLPGPAALAERGLREVRRGRAQGDVAASRRSAAPTCTATGSLIPHVTNHDDADITDLEAFRVQLNKENEKGGVKVTMLAFLIKAAVAALKKFPEFNASLDASGEAIVFKKYFHIGFAADTPNGLVVPVIKDADRKGIFQISSEMGELAKKARDGKLGPADMSGGCFSISSLGGIGGRYFTPIINAPEVSILGVCRSNLEAALGRQGLPAAG